MSASVEHRGVMFALMSGLEAGIGSDRIGKVHENIRREQ